MSVSGRGTGRTVGLYSAVVKATTDSFQMPWYPKIGLFIFSIWFSLVQSPGRPGAEVTGTGDGGAGYDDSDHRARQVMKCQL